MVQSGGIEVCNLVGRGDSRICQGSVCHTDGARTYKQLGDVDSPLLDREVFDVEFSDLHLAHTAVKHKPPRPEFAKTFQVKVWTGSAWVQEERQGGTQKLDGFFASSDAKLAAGRLTRLDPVFRRPPTWSSTCTNECAVSIFADWLSGSDLFQVFGALRSAELSGGASWATLAPFLADRTSAKKDEGIIETIESGSDE